MAGNKQDAHVTGAVVNVYVQQTNRTPVISSRHVLSGESAGGLKTSTSGVAANDAAGVAAAFILETTEVSTIPGSVY